jgi:hypothetical protein
LDADFRLADQLLARRKKAAQRAASLKEASEVGIIQGRRCKAMSHKQDTKERRRDDGELDFKDLMPL